MKINNINQFTEAIVPSNISAKPVEETNPVEEIAGTNTDIQKEIKNKNNKSSETDIIKKENKDDKKDMGKIITDYNDKINRYILLRKKDDRVTEEFPPKTIQKLLEEYYRENEERE